MTSERGAAGGDFESGRVVAERYEILAAIGQGTTGTVYRARDLYVDSDEEIVALKAIHAHLHSDRQIFGRFKREVAILRRLEGPNLCKLLECVQEDGLLLIVLEHVDGPALDDYARERGPLPISEVIAIMIQVCNALAVAHAADVVHRDLKPSNVLVQGMGRSPEPGDDEAETKAEAPLSFMRDLRVRVVDFGLAKMVAGDGTGTALTETDMIFGTPDYMAPEQVAGEELDARCDIYAAGVMLYELAVGQVPFDTPGALTTMAAHMNTPVPPPRQVAPQRAIPVSLERCIMKALAKDPAERQASARELADELGRLSEDAVVEDEDTADTDVDHAKSAISTTMESFRDEVAAAAERERAARVKVVVREAQPASRDPISMTTASSRLRAQERARTADGERRIWAAVALIAAVVAVLTGVWLGAR